MLVPGGLLLLLRATLHRKSTRSPRQQATVDAAQTKLKLKPRKPRLECQFCYESKEFKHFVKGVFLPWNCQSHLTGPNRVCKACLEASISAQLDSKALLDIGCPQCGTAWEPEDLRMLAGAKDTKRFREMDTAAQKRVFVPSELPDLPTLDDMLVRGTRLCPSCLFPFVKLGGCDSMLCGKCGKYFNVTYAPVLEDGKGRRAVDVGDESNADLI